MYLLLCTCSVSAAPFSHSRIYVACSCVFVLCQSLFLYNSFSLSSSTAAGITGG